MGDLKKENLAVVLHDIQNLKVENIPLPEKPGPEGKNLMRISNKKSKKQQLFTINRSSIDNFILWIVRV